MAKGILEYDLNDFDDAMAHRRAVKSTSMAIVLHEIVYNLHKRIEHGIEAQEFSDKEITPMNVIHLYRSAIADLIEENNIIIDDLIN